MTLLDVIKTEFSRLVGSADPADHLRLYSLFHGVLEGAHDSMHEAQRAARLIAKFEHALEIQASANEALTLCVEALELSAETWSARAVEAEGALVAYMEDDTTLASMAIESAKTALGAVLDTVDYERGACHPNEMVGAVLPPPILRKVRELADWIKSADEAL